MFYILVIVKGKLHRMYERDSFEGAIERAIELAVARGEAGKEGKIAVALVCPGHCYAVADWSITITQVIQPEDEDEEDQNAEPEIEA